jgi:hypothetical protein
MVSRKFTAMTSSTPVQSGKKYLSVRCNGVSCDNVVIYAELSGEDNAQDDLERQFQGKIVTCSRCQSRTRIDEGLIVLVR